MTATDWLVIAAGLAAAAWVNWYFFVAERRTALAVAAPAASGGMPQVDIVVRGAYTPATIRVPAGRPVRLVFDRQETSSCSEEVVFPDFGVRKFLPANRKTPLEITPPAPGTYDFTCGMGMLHGRVIAE
jgi:plastocyanin domain-containing protein